MLKALPALVLIAACAPDTSAQPLPDVDVVVVMDDVFFEPDLLEVPAGETVTVLLDNVGGIVHDLVFDGFESGDVRPGRQKVVEISVDQDVVAYCSIPGHRDAGMVLEISAIR